jgi:hypothetical protein
MGIIRSAHSKKIKVALIYKMRVAHNQEDGTLTIDIPMDEMNWKEFRVLTKHL